NSPGRGTCWNLQFKITIPKAAEDHPIWKIVDDPAKNKQVLARMPIFTGSNLVERLKPAAMALGYSDRALPRVGVQPVFACESYAQGPTFGAAPRARPVWGRSLGRRRGREGGHPLLPQIVPHRRLLVGGDRRRGYPPAPRRNRQGAVPSWRADPGERPRLRRK